MNGWIQEDEKWFYYQNGTKVIGFYEIDDSWYYFDTTGIMVTGWKEIDNQWYYFYKTSDAKKAIYKGQMSYGWLKDDGHWYYLCEKSDSAKAIYKGMMMTGWVQDSNGTWYYLLTATDSSKAEYKGAMVENCTRTIDGKSYSFNEDGSLKETTSSDSLISDEGVEFVGSWEGFYSKAYEDPYYPNNQSWWTIGYGTTYAVTPSAFPNGLNSTCTKDQAIGWLRDEMSNCATTIKNKLASNSVTLSQNEFDALVSFAYNCGTGGLFGSTLWKNVIAGVKDSSTITANFQAWSKANGVVSQGLLNRRNKEAAMFINGDYTGNV